MHNTNAIPARLREQYLRSLLLGDKRDCAAIVQRLLDDGMPVRTLYVDLFQDALYSVGALWERNQISVATEHLATSVTLSLFQLVYPRVFSIPRIGRTALVACATDEHHHIGARMVSDVCELHGWDCHFTGSNTPVDDLCRMVVEKRPEFLGISLTLFANVGNLLQLIRSVRHEMPSLPIVVGGQAFRDGGLDILEDFSAVTYYGSLDEFEAFLDPTYRYPAA
ncbi:MAG: cobalamin-dependent protein [Bacteroidota bacterium]|nr:cobalamin-dependent protein [Bacteroidota bacterium]